MPKFLLPTMSLHRPSRKPRRGGKLALEILEDRFAPAHLELVGGGIGFATTASAMGADPGSAQQLITDIQADNPAVSQTATAIIPSTPDLGSMTIGSASGTVGAVPGNMTGEGVDTINLSAFGQGESATEPVNGTYNLGSSSGTIGPSFGTPVSVIIVADPGDKVGQSVVVHMNLYVNGSGEPGALGSAAFSYVASASYKGKTLSLLNGNFNPLDGANLPAGTSRDSTVNQKTIAAKIGDTFSLTLSLTGTSSLSSPGSVSASLSSVFFITPQQIPAGVSWNKDSSSGGGIYFSYTVPQDSPLPDSTTLGYYWASGPDVADILNRPNDPAHMQALSGDQLSPGDHQILVQAATLGKPPSGTMDLIVTLDPSGLPATNPVGTLLASTQEILKDSVKVKIDPADPTGIIADFQPEGGALTLFQAAAIVGVDHFNWQQTFYEASNTTLYIGDDISYDADGKPEVLLNQKDAKGNILPPMYSNTDGSHKAGDPIDLLIAYDANDPIIRTDAKQMYFELSQLPQGGVKWGDIEWNHDNSLPTYLAEDNAEWNGFKTVDRTGAPFPGYGTKDPFTLQFYDRPSAPDYLLFGRNGDAARGYFISFHTSLVGVKDISVVPLDAPLISFDWKSNTTYNGGGVSGLTQMSFGSVAVPPAISGGVFGIALTDGNPGPHTLAISGVVFADFNGNGVLDSSESGLDGQTVFLDLNNDGTFDPGDPAAVTDAKGNFTFTNLASGSYTVRQGFLFGNVTASGGPGQGIPVNLGATPATGVTFGDVIFGPAAPVLVNQDIFGKSNANSDVAYVRGLYQTLLGRAGSTSELQQSLTSLDGGQARVQVAQDVIQSPEHRGLEVDSYYQNFLHRTASASERDYWVHAFLAGSSETTELESFLNSTEFSGSQLSDSLFVQNLYASILGRSGTSDEMANLQAQLAGGTTRGQLINEFLLSPEENKLAILGFYAAYLHRSATADPRSAFWKNVLMAGTALGTVQAGILGDASYHEFFNDGAASVS
jgi:Domain of unknown function (DUF4214)/SdrD B-like domain